MTTELHIDDAGFLEKGSHSDPNQRIDLTTQVPTTVERHTWDTSRLDLREKMSGVQTNHLIELLSYLNEGRINGHSSMATTSNCGCFIATVGRFMAIDKYGDYSNNEWATFTENYGEHIKVNTPFQEWLYLVDHGDTPTTNTIAALFAQELANMIDERMEEPAQ